MNPFPIRSSHTPALPPHNEISLSTPPFARISVHSLVYRDSTSAQLALKIETKYWHLNYIHLSTIRHLTFSHHFTLNFINQLCSWLSNKRKFRCVWIQKCQCSSAKFNRFERHFPVIIIITYLSESMMKAEIFTLLFKLEINQKRRWKVFFSMFVS